MLIIYENIALNLEISFSIIIKHDIENKICTSLIKINAC